MKHLTNIFRITKNLISLFNLNFKKVFFGFINNGNPITPSKKTLLKSLIYSNKKEIRKLYENNFSNLIGDGYGLAFAACRMAFYFILQNHNIKKGDEVLILGFNCSVMANAVIKAGATPIYHDIDPETFGSCPQSIKRLISPKTKAIVAQHSFGIPCKIDEIQTLAKLKGILLIEDCALTLGSKIGEKKVGTFGDYAIFSTDHSKPINTLIGGFLYTENENFFNRILINYRNLNELTINHQKKLLQQLEFESKFCNNKSYKRFKFFSFIKEISRRILHQDDPYLRLDNSSINHQKYPYPAKMPIFLCKYGLEIISNFKESCREREENLEYFIKEYKNKDFDIILSSVYFSDSLTIMPNRIIWNHSNKANLKIKLSRFLDVDDFWFEAPIISTNLDLEHFKYTQGSCPNAEFSSMQIINLPVNMSKDEFKVLLNYFCRAISL
mgnify:CR=1 FL=1